MGEGYRKRHQLWRFAGGKAEDQTLVAGPELLVGAVDSARDAFALLSDQIGDPDLVGMEFVLVVGVTNRPNGPAGNHLVVDQRVGIDFPGQDDIASLAENLAGHAAIGILVKAGVQDRVGDEVADFVRVTFRDGFGGEEVAHAASFLFSDKEASTVSR